MIIPHRDLILITQWLKELEVLP